MGLDVSAYRKISKVDCVFDAGGEPLDRETGEPLDGDFTKADVNYDYPARADQIENKAVYTYEDSKAFWSGGYGRYNKWRDELAKMAGWPQGKYEQYGQSWDSHAASAWQATEGPFWELINFSDCDGVIGPVTSSKLAKDFAEYQAKAEALQDAGFLERYNEWRQCFEMAADAGMVRFH